MNNLMIIINYNKLIEREKMRGSQRKPDLLDFSMELRMTARQMERQSLIIE